jgi:hypothetical protein
MSTFHVCLRLCDMRRPNFQLLSLGPCSLNGVIRFVSNLLYSIFLTTDTKSFEDSLFSASKLTGAAHLS